MNFEVGDFVRCVCPATVSDPRANDGKLGQIIEPLERRLVGVRVTYCYVVMVDGTPYNAVAEWLSYVPRNARASDKSKRQIDDDFLGVTGRI